MAMRSDLPLAAVKGSEPGELDAILAQLSGLLRAEGFAVAGAVQHNTERPGRRCGMTLEVLPSGERFEISEDRGVHARGCRLDPAGLSGAVHALEHALAAPCDVLILNKFGAQEADGAGFRPALAQALLAGTPVLIGVSEAKRGALETFIGAPVPLLPLSLAVLAQWVRAGGDQRALIPERPAFL